MHSSIDHESALFAELAARNWLCGHSPGLVSAAGMFAALCRYFDDLLESLALRREATLHAYPALLSCEVLKRVEYFDSFPGVATTARESYAISPAICYHTYQALEGKSLAKHPYRVTAGGVCARWEGGRLTVSPERLWCFNMRELVFFGSGAEVSRECRALETKLQRAFARAGVATTLEEATDPFFGEVSRGKRIVQKLKRLKVELRAAIGPQKSLAIASVNHHGSFFTDRMAISFADRVPAQSGCAAIGLERCAWTFLLQNSLDAKRWPSDVQRFLARRKFHAPC
jgi:hypothetical protein